MSIKIQRLCLRLNIQLLQKLKINRSFRKILGLQKDCISLVDIIEFNTTTISRKDGRISIHSCLGIKMTRLLLIVLCQRLMSQVQYGIFSFNASHRAASWEFSINHFESSYFGRYAKVGLISEGIGSPERLLKSLSIICLYFE